MYKNTIFWFRQDLRTFDNIGLIKSIENSENLFPIFILDKNIIPGFLGLSDKKFLFLKESLINLDIELKKLGGKLTVFHDYPEKIIPEIIKKYDINSIYTNKSYSRYGKSRDEKIESYCISNKIEFVMENDYLLNEPDEIEQRKVFTPYFKLWKKQLLEKEIVLQKAKQFNQILVREQDTKQLLDELIKGQSHPYFTIEFGKKRLVGFDFKHYESFRNDLDLDGTSRLSVYLRFGIFSVREVYLKVKDESETYVSELAWREFWQHIDYYFPYTKKYEFQENKRHIKWKSDTELFQKWCEGKTGYPVVDAAMKQLVETNWMHGRARMIVASFLTKDFHIDWRMGEEFFKKHLLDYDENVNFGNWQWSASVGADPKPLRIFNPCLQSEKFDKQAKFIRKYLPVLKTQDIKSIHNPIDNKLDYIDLIVNHKLAQKQAREMYKNPSKTHI
ncbi:MAG: deoxyribodipyrimidine photo-lyase [Candidatus Gracilibacteria bacterium]|nr:deoxyribodipyrimidine photo-lyase [Candidatus Gracilibacteria bacterium]